MTGLNHTKLALLPRVQQKGKADEKQQENNITSPMSSEKDMYPKGSSITIAKARSMLPFLA